MTYKQILRSLIITEKDIIPSDDVLLYIRRFITNESRFYHSLRVAKLSYDIALSNDLEHPERYYICGLLHDIGKNMEKKYSIEIMEKYYPTEVDLPTYAYHAFVGEYILQKYFSIFDKEFLDAVKWHCTGNKEMSTLAKILYAADKIEPGRNFDSTDLINAMLEDYESGFITVLRANKEFLDEKVRLVGKKDSSEENCHALSCYEYYL